jgi:hypothetical protein
MHRRAEIAIATLKRHRLAFTKMGVHNPKIELEDNPGVIFMSEASTGRSFSSINTDRIKLTSDEVWEIADKIDKGFQVRLKALKNAGAELKTVRENYFPGMWTKESVRAFNQAIDEAIAGGWAPDQKDLNTWTATQKARLKKRVQELTKSKKGSDKDGLIFLSRRPFKGNESFRERKTFDDIMTGVEFGLVPISTNPIDLVYLKYQEMDRSIMANGALREWERKGLVKGPLWRPPDSTWAKINDKYGTVWGGPTIPAWKLLQELAKSAKKPLYFHKFGMEVFQDPALKDEINSLRWTDEQGQKHNIHAVKRGRAGRGERVSYSQLIVENLLLNPTKFMDEAPGLYEKLQEVADNDDKLKEILGTPEFTNLKQKLPVGGSVVKGFRFATKPVAEIMNNYLSSTLYNSRYLGVPFKLWMGAANLLNQAQLGVFSAFHAGFTTLDVQISANAEILRDLFGLARGNRSLKALTKTVGKSFIASGRTGITGSRTLKEWENPTLDIPANVPINQLPDTSQHRVAMISKAIELAGGGFKMEHGLRTEQIDAIIKDWYSEKKIKAALRSPIAFVELGSLPILKWLVPRQKAGVFAEMAGRIIEQNPSKTLEELRDHFRQAWNSLDRRLGQVRYDRIFMHNIAKNTAQALIRAPGWSGGTIGEVGGAPKDTIEFFKKWYETGKAPRDIPDRVAYTVALVLTGVAASALLTMVFAKKSPKELEPMDFWAFRDGTLDDQGREQRWVLPTYNKDLFAYWENPAHTLLAKTHPLISLVADIVRGKDYYNVRFRDPKASWIEKRWAEMKYVAKSFIPFWIRGAGKVTETEGGVVQTLKEKPQKIVGPLFGVMPATSAYTMSPAEKVAVAYIGDQTPVGGYSAKQGEKFDVSRKIVKYARKEKLTNEEIQDRIESEFPGTFTTAQINKIVKRGRMTFLQAMVASSRMHGEEAFDVYSKASPKEQEDIRPLVRKKLGSTIKGMMDSPERERWTSIRDSLEDEEERPADSGKTRFRVK